MTEYRILQRMKRNGDTDFIAQWTKNWIPFWIAYDRIFHDRYDAIIFLEGIIYTRKRKLENRVVWTYTKP